MLSKRKIALGSLLLLCLSTGAAAALQYVSITNGVTTALQTGRVGRQYVRISPTETIACQEGRCVTVTEKGEVITSTENGSTFDSSPVGAIIRAADNSGLATISDGNDSVSSGKESPDRDDGRSSPSGFDALVDTETQRIRALFVDRNTSSARTGRNVIGSVSLPGNGASGTNGLIDAEVEAERSRIRELLDDRDNTTSGTGGNGTTGGTNGGINVSGMNCPESRSFLNIFDGAVTCGNDGLTIPIVISGDCPITACILRYRNTTSSPGFGGPIDF